MTSLYSAGDDQQTAAGQVYEAREDHRRYHQERARQHRCHGNARPGQGNQDTPGISQRLCATPCTLHGGHLQEIGNITNSCNV